MLKTSLIFPFFPFCLCYSALHYIALVVQSSSAKIVPLEVMGGQKEKFTLVPVLL